jgi:peptidoglycan/LPS O-acetylase OafA/YrhL
MPSVTTHSDTGTGTTFGYKPALDGLRAIAVGSVIAFHFGAAWAPGGFLGVDTFFVLSGYLITSLLLTEWGRSGTLRFTAFWARRARRLLPALLIALAAVAVWSYFAMHSDQLAAIRSDSLWTLFYSANWHFISSGQSYFALFAEPSPFRHAWSLAIEEQFYLVWPLLTFAALRLARGRPRYLAMFCVAGIGVSSVLLARLYNASDPSRSYYGTDTRASQLLVGALLAIILAKWAPRTPASRAGVQLLGALGAGACIVAFAVADDRDAWLYHGGFLVFAIATAAVITAIVQPARSPLSSMLALRPVRWVGQISYGLYLWHWPVQIAISEARTDLTGWDLALVRLAVTFGAATLSFYLVERPIRHGALRGWKARLAAPVGVAAVGVTILAVTAGATPPPRFLSATPGEVVTVGSTPTPTSLTPPSTAVPGVQPAATALPTRFLLVGDSVAGSLSNGLAAEAARRGLIFNGATRPGCGMTHAVPAGPGGEVVPWAWDCSRGTYQYEQDVMGTYQPQVVLWLSAWEAGDHVFDGVLMRFGTPDGDAALLRDFEVSRQLLTTGGATLVMLTNPPPAERADLGVPDPAVIPRLGHLNVLLREFAAQHADTVKVVDLSRIVCPPGPPCPEYVDGVRLRPRDGGHFHDDGPAWVAPRLFDAVLAAFRSAPAGTPPSG